MSARGRILSQPQEPKLGQIIYRVSYLFFSTAPLGRDPCMLIRRRSSYRQARF
jgi:hypothetical protein